MPGQTVLEQGELGVQLRFHQRGLRAGRVLRWLDGFGLGQALKQFRIGLDLGCLDLDGLGVEQAVTEGRQFIQPFDQIAFEVGNDGLGPFGVALERFHSGGDTRANGFAQGDEGLADGGGTEGQGLEHQHHAIQDHAQRAALLGRLDHATGHIVQGGQQGRDDLVADAGGGQFQLVERIVEVARLRRSLTTHLHAKRLHFGGELIDAVAPLIQERDQLGSRLAEQLHGQRGFLRAIGHGLEALGQIEQHLIGGPQCAVLVLELDADGRESARGIFRPSRGFQHRGGQLAQPLLERFAGHTGLLGCRFPYRQGLDADTDTLRHLVQRVASVDGRFHHRGQTGHGDSHPEVGQHAVDALGGVGEATQAPLDRVESGLGLVDGTDQDLGTIACHQTLSSSC